MLLENVLITDVAAEGRAVARVEGRVVFVPYAIPGDVVDVQVCRRKSGYIEGRVARLVAPAPQRVPAFCPHFGVCGGCKWQPLPYAEQLRYKQRQVEEQLLRLGHLSGFEVSPIIGAAQTRGYRNKLEFTFSNRRWLSHEDMAAAGGEAPTDGNGLGFHIPGMFDKVLDVDVCHLQPEPSNSLRLAVRRFALEHGYTFFDLRRQVGLLRNLIVRTAADGEAMAIVVFAEPQGDKIEALMGHLHRSFPQLTALLYAVNQKRNDTLFDQDIVRYAGRDHIVERMEGLRFRVGAKSFYQTNSAQALELYRVVRRYAGLTGRERVYDLYTGTGTIACFVAGSAAHVVGVECVPESIDDARANAALNGIGNASFYVGDMKDVLTEGFVAQHGRPDVVILDPPRAGLHPAVVQALLRVQPPRMVYVSCNPATQARDLALLSPTYRITAVQPVDMFPQTHHVENVVALNRE